MAQTANVMNGSQFAIYTGSAAGSLTLLAHAQTCSISISEDARDTTVKQSGGWRTLLEGLRSFSVSADNLFAEDAANGEDEMWSLFNTRAKIYFMLSSQVNGTEVEGDTRFVGEGRIASLERSGGVEDNVTFTVSIEGSGPLVREIIT
jgi:predicted secreted protein